MEDYEQKGLFLEVFRIFVFPIFIMLIWNWVVDDIFGLPQIGYWKAWGLYMLVSLFFSSSRGVYLDEIIKRLK